MVEGTSASHSGAAAVGNELAVSGAKKALDAQEQQGDAVKSLLESTVTKPKNAPGNNVDVIA